SMVITATLQPTLQLRDSGLARIAILSIAILTIAVAVSVRAAITIAVSVAVRIAVTVVPGWIKGVPTPPRAPAPAPHPPPRKDAARGEGGGGWKQVWDARAWAVARGAGCGQASGCRAICPPPHAQRIARH